MVECARWSLSSSVLEGLVHYEVEEKLLREVGTTGVKDRSIKGAKKRELKFGEGHRILQIALDAHAITRRLFYREYDIVVGQTLLSSQIYMWRYTHVCGDVFD